jgi:hypothetical protein
MAYEHPEDINLRNLHKSMQYNSLGVPHLRTLSSFGDSGDVSAFGRLRVASTRLLGEFRTHYGTLGPVEIITKFENGGSQTVNLTNANTLINVTNENGSRALRQTRQYHPYIPGTTNLGFITFCFGERKENVQQMVGMFDDSNGIFFRMNGTIPEMVIRKNGVDNEIVTQDQWNVDKFDGTGTSGITLDFSKAQILVIDYQWLGVGRVRVGFNIDGKLIYCHYFSHTNIITEPYSFQPSLPVRWEIKNTDTTTLGSSMMCICYAVYVEGVDSETGFENSVSTGTTSVSITSNDINYGILAVRLKNTVNSKPVRALARLKEWDIITDQLINYKVMILPDSTPIEGTPTWNSATPTGWCEYISNYTLTSFAPTNSIILFDGYAAGSSNKDLTQSKGIDIRSAAIYQNYDSSNSMVLAIVGKRIPNNNAVVRASMQWVEVK